MLFHQLVTGRAPASGWGFIAFTDGFPCSREEMEKLFLGSRNNPMPSGAKIYEIQSLSNNRIAAFCTFMEGGTTVSKYCYTHALLSEDSITADEALGLLTTINFINADQFADLENNPGNSHGLRPEEKRIFGASSFHQLNDNEKKALAAFLPYYWKQCQIRRDGEKELSSAGLIVETSSDYIRAAISLFRTVIIPKLPSKISQLISVVFGIEWNARAAFANTICYVLPNRTDECTSFFDLVSGEYQVKGIDDVDIQLGSMLLEGSVPALYEHFIKQLSDRDEVLADYEVLKLSGDAQYYREDVNHLYSVYKQGINLFEQKWGLAEDISILLLKPIEEQIMKLLAQDASIQALNNSLDFYGKSRMANKACFMQIMECAKKTHPTQKELLNKLNTFILKRCSDSLDEEMIHEVFEFYDSYANEPIHIAEIMNDLMIDNRFAERVALLNGNDYLLWQKIRDQYKYSKAANALKKCETIQSILAFEDTWKQSSDIRPVFISSQSWNQLDLKEEAQEAIEKALGKEQASIETYIKLFDSTNKPGDWYFESLRQGLGKYFLLNFDNIWKNSREKEQLVRLLQIANGIPNVPMAQDEICRFVIQRKKEIDEGNTAYLNSDVMNDLSLKKIDDYSIEYLESTLSHSRIPPIEKGLYIAVLEGKGNIIDWHSVIQTVLPEETLPDDDTISKYKPWEPEGAQLLNAIIVLSRWLQIKNSVYIDYLLNWVTEYLPGFTKAVTGRPGNKWRRYLQDPKHVIPNKVKEWING